MSKKNIFSDLKVIELASVLAGPSVGQFFAELSAEVVKIENPKTNGDVTRSWKANGEMTDDVSAYFSSINWGKKSVVLDISNKSELNKLYQLVLQADIVITSYKPGDDIKLGVDYDSLKAINPKLIYGQITGYGELANRVGYDAIIQAEAGFMNINGEDDGPPLKMPVALMDLLAGHQLKEALLIGYINLLKTGKGSYHTVSLIEAGVASLANQATNYLVNGSEPGRKGSLHPNIAPYGEIFETSDKRQLILAVGNDKQFSALLELLSLEPVKDFSTNVLRVENRSSLFNYLNEKISKHDSEELMNLLFERNIPGGLVNPISQAIHQFGQLIKLESLTGQKGIKTFISKSDIYQNDSHISPPPSLGQHTTEML